MHSFNFEPYITTFNEFLVIRDLTKNTQDFYNTFLRCYLSWVDTALKFMPEEVSFAQIRSYILYLKNIKKLSNRSINAYLSQGEVRSFIGSFPNLKHKACAALLYSSGLRVSELCHLRYEDIDRENLRLYIRPSKSRSDRYAILSPKALAILTEYWFAHGRPKNWLFPGTKPDSPIVSFTVSRFLAD